MKTITIPSPLLIEFWKASGEEIELRDSQGYLVGKVILPSRKSLDLGLTDAEIEACLATEEEEFTTQEVLAHLQGV